MPLYPGAVNATAPVASNVSPIALQKGESCFVFGKLPSGATQLPVSDGNVADETILSGQASIVVNLQPSETNSPPMVCIEGHFSGAPGTIEIDIQESDTDADAFYIMPTASTAYKVTAVNATTQNFRVDLSPTGGKFMRILAVTITNAVNFRCKITRLA